MLSTALRYNAGSPCLVHLHLLLLQYEREAALKDFSAGTVRVLIATDVASRGLDVKDVGHVINMDLPRAFEDYVHRIGERRCGGSAAEFARAFTLQQTKLPSLWVFCSWFADCCIIIMHCQCPRVQHPLFLIYPYVPILTTRVAATACATLPISQAARAVQAHAAAPPPSSQTVMPS